MSRIISKKLDEKETKFEYPHNFYYEKRYIDCLKAKDEVFNLNVIEKTFLDYIEGKEVLDFGGAGGVSYYKFKPKDTIWTVLEVPEVVDFMKKQKIDKNIKFEYTGDIINKTTDRDVCLYSQGTINYLPNPLEFLRNNINKFKVILLEGVYVGKETALVQQERVGPLWIIGLNKLKEVFRKDFNTMYLESGKMWEENTTGVEVYNNFDILAIGK